MIQKKKLTLAAILLVVGIGSAATVFAYFTSNDQVINKFTTGTHKVELHETDWNDDHGDGKNMYPGYTIYKNPTIKNTASTKNGEQNAYVRVIMEVFDHNDVPVTDRDVLDLIISTIRYDATYTGSFSEVGTGSVLEEGKEHGYSLKKLRSVPNFNSLFALDEHRSEDNRFVFNYVGKEKNGILKAGEEAALFTTIAIPLDWTQEEMEQVGDYVLKITEESIQCSGFHDMEDAMTMLDTNGVPEE